MEPGIVTPLTPEEYEEAASNADERHSAFAKWVDEKGKLHREGDMPAFIFPNGSCSWEIHGELHRDGDLPAQVNSNRQISWWQHNKRHREKDRPAVIFPSGRRVWHANGLIHRNNHRPAVVLRDGTLEWWTRGIQRGGNRGVWTIPDKATARAATAINRGARAFLRRKHRLQRVSALVWCLLELEIYPNIGQELKKHMGYQ